MAALTAFESDLLSQLDGRGDAMVEATRRLAEINSGSLHTSGIEAVNAHLIAMFSPLSEHVEQRPLAPIALLDDDGQVNPFNSAPMLIFRARPKAPTQILCTGHSDTVFPTDSPFNTTWIAGEQLHGPGVADMKGGLVVLCEALHAIERSAFRDQIGFTVAISPDEEIGSPASAPVLAELAQTAHFGLTYEPALADGTLAGERKGSGNFSCVISGKSAHAGRDFFSGRNAVTAAAKLAVALEALSSESEGISVNIGKISGGGPVNIVPDHALCRFNVRVRTHAQQRQLERAMATVICTIEASTHCGIVLHGGFNRPPKIITAAQQDLFDILLGCGRQLAIPLKFKATGGCCEGNNLAAAGLVNIDTLGVRGGHIHSQQEFACIDSFIERAKLSALLMAKLSYLKQASQPCPAICAAIKDTGII